jgi:Ca-activated chloride channel family protein
MKRLALVLCILTALVSCKDKKKADKAEAETPQWTAQVAELDSITGSNVEVKTPGGSDFTPWRGGQPIPAGSTVRTPETTRATLTLPDDGELTMNHSTVATLSGRAKITIEKGQAVVAYPPGGESDVTVALPTGEAVLHGTKVALVAGEKESTITVTQGIVEVRHANEAFEGRAGQEFLLREGEPPRLTQSPDLARQLGWSEIGETSFTEELPEVPRGLGKLVGKTPGGETEHRLDLTKHRVDVKVQGNIAYTEITEVFENPTGRTLEGLYRFPLPSDGRISRLALKVGDRVMEGEFLETARAEQIWRDVIHKWRDPAMLKWKEGNTFELRIFPIEPRQKRQVTIGYVQRLEPSVGGYRYTYPMPVDRAGLIPADRFEFEATLYGHDPTLPLEVTGYPAFVENGATAKDEAVTKVRWSADDFVARGDLGIRFGRDKAQGLRTYTYQDRDDKSYAVFALRPDLPARTEIKPRDFVIVVDRSTSRRGAAMKVQRRLVPRLIREMDPLDRVTVVACAERCEPVAEPAFSPARLATSTDVAEALLELEASGATYPVEAVRVAAELFRRRADDEDGREAHVIYMTDGVASAGELRPGRLADAVQATLKPHDARMSIVDIGGNSDQTNLDALATGGRGRVVKLDPMLSMTGQALAILNDHYRNILSNPAVDLPGSVQMDGVLPTAIAAGDEIVFAARFQEPTSGKVKLRGTLNGEPFETVYPVDLKPSRAKGNSFAPAEWAAHRIAGLELEPADHEKEIVRLSKRYGVLSRYTTLLALESKEMMDEYNVRSRDRTQWKGEAEGESSEDAAAEFAEAESTPAPRRTRRRKAGKAKKKPSPRREMKSKGLGQSRSGASAGDDADLSPFFAPEEAAEAEPAPRARPRPKPDTVDLLDGGGSTFTPPPRRHRNRYRRRRPRAQVRNPDSTTSWERKNVRNKRNRLRSDPDNRSRRMALIRAMIRAELLRDARRETEVWLAKNPMDPEAIVQLAQIEAREGNLDTFYQTLISAADAAPRGEWLLKRIHGAAQAENDDAMECAYKVSLEAVAKRPPKTPSDIIACPMTTAVGTWFGEPAPNFVLDPAAKQPSGALEVSLKSSGGDWDLALVEPSGRLLWWGSSRQRLKFENVVGTDRTEFLALPRFRKGTYSVLAIPRDAQENDRLEIKIDAKGKKKTVHVVPRGVEEVAEVVWK